MTDVARRTLAGSEDVEVEWPKHTWTFDDAYCIIPEGGGDAPRRSDALVDPPKRSDAHTQAVTLPGVRLMPLQWGRSVLTNLVTRRKNEPMPSVAP